ncbi:pirin family protein [Azospirillum rugosum]|uniref:Redox-sensitive bicupin YhaK (Pirin superfamily) n=1 Tax=Azospirillum rugosum TaxID=416170 RepID=A0ABS4SSQ3_9PROT|nr:pirin family protein [Azospirillum rugosum]MBP2295593.1 redox-sensitive bicupin YhaK (pirin superfamily) [Azospirillum rugosum]MDQ0529517.1 redox-sensitive bicupin YhaK (pirin superfamily) [Azospirillum rugosum]
MSAATIRPVLSAVAGMEASDGAGVRMTRMVGTPQLRMLDPFLMLDYFGSDEPQDYLAGFPDHPHRGFETVTYMLAGRMRHWDNHGHEGVIETGGVQWMTAGRGVIHSEMPEQTEGLMKGFQLWINLPASLKMSEPRYQEFAADRIPVETRADGATVTVIAGTTEQGTVGPIQAGPTEARYFDVRLPEGATFAESAPAGHTAALIVFEGSITVPGHSLRLGGPRVVTLGEGDRVEVTAGPAGARFLLLTGRPIGEPVAWGGPFVMNTRDEVVQAYRDFEEGRF